MSIKHQVKHCALYDDTLNQRNFKKFMPALDIINENEQRNYIKHSPPLTFAANIYFNACLCSCLQQKNKNVLKFVYSKSHCGLLLNRES